MRSLLVCLTGILLLYLLPLAHAQNARTAETATGGLTPRALRQRAFNIPFSADRSRMPTEVQLYVSADGGAHWHFYAREHPSARQFRFRASRDGQYWFASRTIEANRTPLETNQLQPELVVVVDTMQPELDFEAEVGDSGEVTTVWHATDPSLDDASLKIEYQSTPNEAWQPVAVQRNPRSATDQVLSGKMTWWPQTDAQSIVVRAEVSDQAGNKTVVNRRVSLPTTTARQAWRPVGQRGVPPDPFAGRQPSSSGAVSWPEDNQVATVDPLPEPSPSNDAAGDAGSSGRGGGFENPYYSTSSNRQTSPFRTAQDSQRSAAPPAVPGRNQLAEQRNKLDSPGPNQSAAPRPNQPAAPRERPAEADTTRSRTIMREAGRTTDGLPQGERPRMTRSRRFQLEYEVDAVGANGAREVELWGTNDGGQSWTKWSVDPDRQSPLDVEVDEDGVYGFRVVIVGNNGLVGDSPRNGDLADLWVAVDTTPPMIRITTAAYGEGEHAGKLDIQWSAEDRWFGDRPVTLMFAEQPSGPWTTIASGLPNGGRYYWPIDPRIPKQIYLRIEARDDAGNLGEHQLADVIDIAALTPRARIRGLRPVPNERGAFRNPFFR